MPAPAWPWLEELGTVVSKLPSDTKQSIGLQLSDFLEQVEFVRKAQIVQLEFAQSRPGLQRSHEDSTHVDTLSESKSEEGLSKEGEMVLELFFSLQDVLNGEQLMRLASMLKCSTNAIAAWFSEKRQAYRALCNKVKKRKREGDRGPAHGPSVVRQPGFGRTPAMMSPAKQAKLQAAGEEAKPGGAQSELEQLRASLDASDPRVPRFRRESASRALQFLRNLQSTFVKGLFLQALCNTSAGHLMSLNIMESFHCLAAWLEAAMTAEDWPMVCHCLAALAKIPYTDVHLSQIARQRDARGGSSGGGPRATFLHLLSDLFGRREKGVADAAENLAWAWSQRSPEHVGRFFEGDTARPAPGSKRPPPGRGARWGGPGTDQKVIIPISRKSGAAGEPAEGRAGANGVAAADRGAGGAALQRGGSGVQAMGGADAGAPRGAAVEASGTNGEDAARAALFRKRAEGILRAPAPKPKLQPQTLSVDDLQKLKKAKAAKAALEALNKRKAQPAAGARPPAPGQPSSAPPTQLATSQSQRNSAAPNGMGAARPVAVTHPAIATASAFVQPGGGNAANGVASTSAAAARVGGDGRVDPADQPSGSGRAVNGEAALQQGARHGGEGGSGEAAARLRTTASQSVDLDGLDEEALRMLQEHKRKKAEEQRAKEERARQRAEAQRAQRVQQAAARPPAQDPRRDPTLLACACHIGAMTAVQETVSLHRRALAERRQGWHPEVYNALQDAQEKGTRWLDSRIVRERERAQEKCDPSFRQRLRQLESTVDWEGGLEDCVLPSEVETSHRDWAAESKEVKAQTEREFTVAAAEPLDPAQPQPVRPPADESARGSSQPPLKKVPFWEEPFEAPSWERYFSKQPDSYSVAKHLWKNGRRFPIGRLAVPKGGVTDANMQHMRKVADEVVAAEAAAAADDGTAAEAAAQAAAPVDALPQPLPQPMAAAPPALQPGSVAPAYASTVYGSVPETVHSAAFQAANGMYAAHNAYPYSHAAQPSDAFTGNVRQNIDAYQAYDMNGVLNGTAEHPGQPSTTYGVVHGHGHGHVNRQ